MSPHGYGGTPLVRVEKRPYQDGSRSRSQGR
jgi:hypothetical protein